VVFGFVSLVTPTEGTALGGAALAGTLQQAVLEVIEGPHTGNILRVKAADQGIEGVIVHHRHPDIETGHLTFDHRQTGAQHTSRLSGQTSLVGRVKRGQDGISLIEVECLEFAIDLEMAMASAQRAVATCSFAYQTEKAPMWKKGW
jgi:hypothetical protein